MQELTRKMRLYYAVSLLSVVFAVVGFSYNTWRLEISEENNTVRTAAFEMFEHLAQLEQIIYSAYYDDNVNEGNPRKAWVKVGVISDLGVLMSVEVQKQSDELKKLWQVNWQKISTDEQSVNVLVAQVDEIRSEIKKELISLN